MLENWPTTFTDGLTSLNGAAYDCLPFRLTIAAQNFLSLLAPFVTEISREFFLVPKLNQYPLDTNSKTADIIASFIDFLVNAFVILTSSHTPSWIIINPGQIDILCKRLKVLPLIPLETAFPCTKMEEEIKNILGEIKSIANEAGNFLYSFFFTTDHITMTTMDLELSRLLRKLDLVEEMIKQPCVTIFKQQKSTTLNFTSASIFIVDSLLDDLKHVLNHKAGLIVEVKDQITTLHKELYSSRSMLRDIELQQNKELIDCEMQLINLAYQAEPIIACFVAGDVTDWYLALRVLSFIQKNKTILAKLANIKINSGIQGILQAKESSNELFSSQVDTKSIPVVNEVIVGFEVMTRLIASQLTREPNRLHIISIVGMGGSGKTTLAKELFNDANVLLRFDKRAWCVVSQTYQRRNLLIDILRYVSPRNKDEISKMEDHQLIDHLHKSLKGIRYLLVMDDIWKKEVWDDLRRYFPEDGNGSRILFTTRNKDVALHASLEDFIHDVPSLTDEQCWDLLQTKVFPNSLCPRELQDVGKKIAKNCKGLPLAIVGIAAILANIEKKEVLWQEVATRLSSYISEGRDTLELSYKHLPSHLKPCFLYLGIFKEDTKIQVRQLLSLWISERFIPTIEGKSPEDVAEDCLLELINRSMVQPAKTRSDKGVKTCTIHDVMRDMALRLADEENFFKVIDEEYSIDEQQHHICCHSNSSNFKRRLLGSHIRSFSGEFPDLSFITSKKMRLKVLKLSDPFITANYSKFFNQYKEYDGTPLELLVELRYLECDGTLRNFCSHMKLEFLRLRKSRDTGIQWNMPKLKHLQFGEYQTIPEGLEYSRLQTLSRILINDSNDEIRLSRLFHLRRLRCRYGETYVGSPNLGSLARLVSLNVQAYFRSEFKAFIFPTKIKKLSISSVTMTPEFLLSIGALPNLGILKMRHILFREAGWGPSEDLFKNVKFLKLHDVFLVEWNISTDHFPSLETLLLSRVDDMCGPLPSELGYIPTLQRIELDCCNGIVERSARLIMEEQEAYGNEQLEVIILKAW